MYGIADTGATQNYIKFHAPFKNKVEISRGYQVILSDEIIIQATHREEINLRPLLTTRSKIAHILPHLQSGALIFIGQLCDDGCTGTFTNSYMIVEKKVHLVL